MRSRKVFVLFFVLLLTFASGIYLGGKIENARNPVKIVVKEKTDTLYHRDTITLSKPTYIAKERKDSILVPVRDTILLRDTLFVALERESLVWEDSLARVYASGVRVEVDSVRHFTEKMVVIKEITAVRTEKPKFSIGVQAGAGVSNAGLTPYIGIGVTYNLLSW